MLIILNKIWEDKFRVALPFKFLIQKQISLKAGNHLIFVNIDVQNSNNLSAKMCLPYVTLK